MSQAMRDVLAHLRRSLIACRVDPLEAIPPRQIVPLQPLQYRAPVKSSGCRLSASFLSGHLSVLWGRRDIEGVHSGAPAKMHKGSGMQQLFGEADAGSLP